MNLRMLQQEIALIVANMGMIWSNYELRIFGSFFIVKYHINANFNHRNIFYSCNLRCIEMRVIQLIVILKIRNNSNFDISLPLGNHSTISQSNTCNPSRRFLINKIYRQDFFLFLQQIKWRKKIYNSCSTFFLKFRTTVMKLIKKETKTHWFDGNG